MLAGQDHPDRWYRNGRLVAVVHYPYGMEHDELAVAVCARLGLKLESILAGPFTLAICGPWPWSSLPRASTASSQATDVNLVPGQ